MDSVSWWPSRFMWGVLGAGSLLLVALQIFLPDRLQSLGPALVIAFVAGFGATQRLATHVAKGEEPTTDPQELADSNSWRNAIEVFVTWLALTALVCAVLYFAPRLVGLSVDPYLALLIAALIVSLLLIEWGALEAG